MPKYRYQATDAEGNPISGELEAAGLEAARQKLAAQGLDADRAQLTEIPEQVSAAGRLSPEEAGFQPILQIIITLECILV